MKLTKSVIKSKNYETEFLTQRYIKNDEVF